MSRNKNKFPVGFRQNNFFKKLGGRDTNSVI
nr:MAG TPA: hypothetical protein [Caudoviricetes sp.]